MKQDLNSLLMWEECTALAINEDLSCCRRREALDSAFQISLDLVDSGNIYLEYVSSFCLLGLATENYVKYLAELDLMDEAMAVLDRSRLSFSAYENKELPDEIQQLAREESERLF